MQLQDKICCLMEITHYCTITQIILKRRNSFTSKVDFCYPKQIPDAKIRKPTITMKNKFNNKASKQWADRRLRKVSLTAQSTETALLLTHVTSFIKSRICAKCNKAYPENPGYKNENWCWCMNFIWTFREISFNELIFLFIWVILKLIYITAQSPKCSTRLKVFF